jgi:hypothetical protein
MSRSAVVKMAMTTSDLPHVLGGGVEKSLLARFEAMADDHRRLCELVSVPDFKPQTVVNLSLLPTLQPKPEMAEIIYGALHDQLSESLRLGTFATILGFSREAWTNDDLGALNDAISNAATSAVRCEREQVIGALTDGRAMADGDPLFHANHKNLNTEGHGVDLDGLNAGRVLLRRQKDISGGYLLNQPQYIVAPVGLEGHGEALIASLTYRPSADVERETPRWVRSLAIVADPRLDDLSATTWYLLSDPRVNPTIRVGHLNGQTGPTVEQESDFERDILKFKIRFDVVAVPVNWTGAVKMS